MSISVMSSATTGFRNKYEEWNLGFTEEKGKTWTEGKKLVHGCSTDQTSFPQGTSKQTAQEKRAQYMRTVKCWRMMHSCSSPTFPVSSVITLNTAWCTLFFPFQCSLPTHPDFALITMKASVVVIFFGKYSWCATISSLWICTPLSWLTSDSTADEALCGR